MKGKKLLAGALSAAMLFSTASFTAFAEEIAENAESGIQVLNTTPVAAYVAEVNGIQYSSLQAAIDAIPEQSETFTDNTTVKLLNDIQVDPLNMINPKDYDSEYASNNHYTLACISNKNVTIDLNGKKISYKSNKITLENALQKRFHTFVLLAESNVTVKGNGTIENIVPMENWSVDQPYTDIFFMPTLSLSNLIIEDGTYSLSAYQGNEIIYNLYGGGVATVNGGKYFLTNEEADDDFDSSQRFLINLQGTCECVDWHKFYINGGSFYKHDPRCLDDSTITGNTVTEGHAVTKDGNWYTVINDSDVAAEVAVAPTAQQYSPIYHNNPMDPTILSYTSVDEAKKAAKELIGENYVEVMANGKPRYCASYKTAFEKANNGDTIKLLNDIEFDEEVVIDKDITIDFDNKKVTVNSNWDKETYPTLFRIYSNVTVKNGNMDTSTTSDQGAFCFMVGKLIDNKVKSGSLVIENGTYKAYNTVAQASYGTVEVLGGDYSIAPWIQNEETENYEFMFNCLDTPYKNGECSVKIKGGTFAKFDPSNNEAEGKGTDFVADGFKSVAGNNNRFEVIKIEATIIDIASTSDVTVQLEKLYKNEKIDVLKDATYEVVVSNVSKDDKAKVDEIANIAIAAGQSVFAYDIKVVKTENGKTEKVDVENQQVTITLPTAVPENEKDNIKIYHIDSTGTQTEITDIIVSEDGTKIAFTAPSFSTYVVTYNATPIADDDITDKITVDFEKVTGKDNEYDIVLKADSGKKINGLTTADLTFALTQGTGVVDYEIKPVANINILNPSKNRYEFNFDGINAYNATSDRIVIGKVVFGGYCDGAKFEIATADTNIVHTTKTANAIVDEYTVNGAENVLDVSVAINSLTIAEETKELTINIDFPNTVKDNDATYQDMKISIVSANSNDEIALGDNMTTDGKYVVTKELVKNRSYTVTVSGAGYRTARYTVTMTADKVLNFWNNVKDNATEVEEGDTSSAKNVTFLAGELVKDGQINIYDLSAVVSYFGTDNLVTEHPDYARYDLNRDGKIDSKDVAYVLVSWGK